MVKYQNYSPAERLLIHVKEGKREEASCKFLGDNEGKEAQSITKSTFGLQPLLPPTKFPNFYIGGGAPLMPTPRWTYESQDIVRIYCKCLIIARDFEPIHLKNDRSNNRKVNDQVLRKRRGRIIFGET